MGHRRLTRACADGRMAAGRRFRGKSGLHEATVPGNARPGQLEGKRHREQSALVNSTEVRLRRNQGKGETVGQEPTAGRATGPARQAPPGAMPNRDLAPAVRKDGAGRLRPERSGLAARSRRQRRGQRNGHPEGATPWTESGLQAIRAYLLKVEQSDKSLISLVKSGVVNPMARISAAAGEAARRNHGSHSAVSGATLWRT
jgi:hypothetical protein